MRCVVAVTPTSAVIYQLAEVVLKKKVFKYQFLQDWNISLWSHSPFLNAVFSTKRLLPLKTAGLSKEHENKSLDSSDWQLTAVFILCLLLYFLIIQYMLYSADARIFLKHLLFPKWFPEDCDTADT